LSWNLYPPAGNAIRATEPTVWWEWLALMSRALPDHGFAFLAARQRRMYSR
jgi:hypothetical protein